MAKRNINGLNDREQRFVAFYHKTLNGVEAAILAGYSKHTAPQIASRLLKKELIKKEIDKLNNKFIKKTIADATEIKERLTAIIRGEVEEEVLITEGRGYGKSETVKRTKRVDAFNIIKACELLGKSYSMFKEKVEVDNAVVIIKGEDELLD